MHYIILEALVEKLQKKVTAFDHKLAKYGNGHVTCKVGKPHRCADEHSPYFKRVIVEVDVDGSYQVCGYTFVASLEWQDRVHKNLVKTAPGSEELPEHFLTSTKCEHCGVERYRKHTIVLRNEESGKYIQVGKSCVKDYLGCDINQYASYLSFWTDLDDYCASVDQEFISGTPLTFDVDYVLQQACAEIGARGFISKSMAVERELTPTAGRVYDLLTQQHDKYGNLIVPEYKTTQLEASLTEEFKTWVNEESPDTSYYNNVRILVELGYVELGFQLNTLVSALGLFIKKKNQQSIERQAAAESVSDFVGAVGDKIELVDVKPECVYSVDSTWGVYYKYRFVFNNNIIIWGTSRDLNCDSLFTIKGTVKSHDTYKGIKQTEITRCKVLEEKKSSEEPDKLENLPDYLDLDF